MLILVKKFFGAIILAFILGFPANEIVIPIMLMCYLNSGTLVEYSNLMELKMILVLKQNYDKKQHILTYT